MTDCTLAPYDGCHCWKYCCIVCRQQRKMMYS